MPISPVIQCLGQIAGSDTVRVICATKESYVLSVVTLKRYGVTVPATLSVGSVVDMTSKGKVAVGDWVVFDLVRGLGRMLTVTNIRKFEQGDIMSGQFYIHVKSVRNDTPKVFDSANAAPGTTVLLITFAGVRRTSRPEMVAVPFDKDTAVAIAKGIEPADAWVQVRSAADELVFDNGGETFGKTVAPKVSGGNTLTSDGFYFEPALRDVFGTAANLIKGGTPHVNIMLTGPSGYGKTEASERFASRLGFKFYRLNCSLQTDPAATFGAVRASEGSTYTVLSLFTQIMREGNVVIVLDEINRMPPTVANFVLQLLDGGRFVEVENEIVHIGKNVIFVATRNEGAGFVGTYPLDLAVKNRFALMAEVGNIPATVEANVLVVRHKITQAEATQIVNIASMLRTTLAEENCSMRTTLDVAEALKGGCDMRSAWQYGFVNGITHQDNKDAATLQLNRELGAFAEGHVVSDISWAD